MGREVRMVPSNWRHPKDKHGDYIPLFDHLWAEQAYWRLHKMMWDAGYIESYIDTGIWLSRSGDQLNSTYEEWEGEQPEQKDYIPDWPTHERTHYMMYESVTEGTPISPAFATKEDLASWLVRHEGHDYEIWLSIIEQPPRTATSIL
jgi:hypothetical protein